MAGLKWNTGKLYYSTVELGYQQVRSSSVVVVVVSLVVVVVEVVRTSGSGSGSGR